MVKETRRIFYSLIFFRDEKLFAQLKYGTLNLAIGEKDPEGENFAFLIDDRDELKKNHANQHLSAQESTVHVLVDDPATYAHGNRISCLET